MPSPRRHVLPTIARILLGLPFVVFGLNFFLNFIPPPKSMPAGAGAFAGALMASGYVMQVVKVTEIATGLLLLANRFVPLALALLAPVLVGILGFHAMLEPSGLPLPLILLALELYLAWAYRGAFAPMLRARVAPTASADGGSASGVQPLT